MNYLRDKWVTTCRDGRCMVKLNQAERRLVQGFMFTRGKAWQWDKKKVDCPRNIFGSIYIWMYELGSCQHSPSYVPVLRVSVRAGCRCTHEALARRPLQNPHQPDFHGKFQSEQGHVKELRLDYTTQKMSDQVQFPSEQWYINELSWISYFDLQVLRKKFCSLYESEEDWECQTSLFSILSLIIYAIVLYLITHTHYFLDSEWRLLSYQTEGKIVTRREGWILL